MPTRHDYSAIAPLGACVAKRCPARVLLDHDGLEAYTGAWTRKPI